MSEDIGGLPPSIPLPLELAVTLTVERDKNGLDHRSKVMCDTGLLLYWVASEIHELTEVLKGASGPDDPEQTGTEEGSVPDSRQGPSS